LGLQSQQQVMEMVKVTAEQPLGWDLARQLQESGWGWGWDWGYQRSQGKVMLCLQLQGTLR
jgi:hypothetical protein